MLPATRASTVIQPDERQLSGGSRADLGRLARRVVICAFGALIREPLLSEHPMLNVHPSLLPRWRGAAPIERAIEAGDATTGVSIMRPIAEMDAGPICLCEEPIQPDDDFGSLSPRFADARRRAARRGAGRAARFVQQPNEGSRSRAKIAPMTAGSTRRSPRTLARRVRALQPARGHLDRAARRRPAGSAKARPRRLVGDARTGRAGRGRRPPAVRNGRRRARAARGPAGRGRPMDAAAFLRGTPTLVG